MAYVPYGYTITDGVVTVDERAADQVRDFFEKYISGLSLAVAGEQAGIQKTHSSMGCRCCGNTGNGFFSSACSIQAFRLPAFRLRCCPSAPGCRRF